VNVREVDCAGSWQIHQPSYLSNLLAIQPNVHNTRSSTLVTLQRSPVVRAAIVKRSFFHSAPALWNSLPPALRQPAPFNRRHTNPGAVSQLFPFLAEDSSVFKIISTINLDQLQPYSSDFNFSCHDIVLVIRVVTCSQCLRRVKGLSSILIGHFKYQFTYLLTYFLLSLLNLFLPFNFCVV